MQFQFDITTAAQPTRPVPTSNGPEAVPELLRHILDLQREGFMQMLEVQRAHLAHAQHVHQEHLQRWKNVMARWNKVFPDLASQCKKVYPALERSFLTMTDNMVQDLMEVAEDGFDSDFALQEFLDRHGMRVGQLAHLLSIIGPLSEAGSAAAPEAPSGGA